MYTQSDIQYVARKIHNEKSDLSSKENLFKSELSIINTWWVGLACNSFIEGYLETRFEISRLCSHISGLEDKLRKLASEVQRADDERRRIEADKARKQQQRKNYMC